MERFIVHRSHHSSAILSIDTCGRYLATGGGDDRVVVIDLKLNKDVQVRFKFLGLIWRGEPCNCYVDLVELFECLVDYIF